ncbi:hypothetical protein ACWENQ_05400 [Nonomuraea sp. NPDC004354]
MSAAVPAVVLVAVLVPVLAAAAGCSPAVPASSARTAGPCDPGPCAPGTSGVPGTDGPGRGPRDPMPPVSGRPLPPGSGLRLLVTGDSGAFRFDVDSGVRTELRGLPDGRPVWSFTAGTRELVVTTPADPSAEGRLFLLSGDRARPLGGAVSSAFAAADGKGVWVLQRARGDDGCRLRPLDFRGRERGPVLPIACSRAPAQDTPQGLLSYAAQERARLLDRTTGEEVFAEERVHAVTRDLVLVSRASRLSLVEPAAGRRTPLPSPVTGGSPSTAEVSPDGRLIALWFADPAWPGPRQYLDVQVLDVRARTWTRLPSMPVPASLKSTSMAWSRDGRLVLTGDFVTTDRVMPAETDYAGFVAAWRPGEPRLSLRRLTLPPRHQARLVP